MNRIIARAATVAAATGCTLALAGMTAAGSVASSTLPTLTVALAGKTVAVGGYEGAGAVNVATTVTGVKTGSIALIRLNNGIPFSDFAVAAAAVAAHHGDINYIDPYGSLVFDQPVAKGANVAQTVLASGNYFALNIGTNAKTPPFTAFVVKPNPYAVAALPKPSATVSTIDFGFTGASTLHNGELVRFQNNGFLVHMIVAAQVKSMAMARKVTALLKAGKDNQANKDAIGFADFIDGMSSGGLSQYVIHQSPGIYVLVCFMDTQDGREHTRLGMERTIRITK